MDILNSEFIKGFIRVTDDAYRKGWHERNGGNLSYRIKTEEINEIKDKLNFNGVWTQIGIDVQSISGEFFLVTGSGKFFRNVILNPEENIGIIEIDDSGSNYRICWGLSGGGKPTSELPTHLNNHGIKKLQTNGANRVVMHSHPTNIIALTFVLPLNDAVFTRELWEMATECPLVFPDGVGVVPWKVPGGKDIALATAEKMHLYNVAIWAHHGMFCCGETLDLTFGLMDTVEKSAEILVKVLSMGFPAKRQTILPDEIKKLSKDFGIPVNEEFLK